MKKRGVASCCFEVLLHHVRHLSLAGRCRVVFKSVGRCQTCDPLLTTHGTRAMFRSDGSEVGRAKSTFFYVRVVFGIDRVEVGC